MLIYDLNVFERVKLRFNHLKVFLRLQESLLKNLT